MTTNADACQLCGGACTDARRRVEYAVTGTGVAVVCDDCLVGLAAAWEKREALPSWEAEKEAVRKAGCSECERWLWRAWNFRLWQQIMTRKWEQARRELGSARTESEWGLIAKLRREVREQQVSLEAKNRALDSMHWVWCDGGCSTGVHRYDEEGPAAVTAEVVAAAVRNTERLRRWWATWESGRIAAAEKREAEKGTGDG